MANLALAYTVRRMVAQRLGSVNLNRGAARAIAPIAPLVC